MKKGEVTKKHIIEQVAKLMNQRGFTSTSLAEIVEVSGLQKGGIYNHFKDKEEIILLAFDQCCKIMWERIESELQSKTSEKDRLLAFIEAYFSFGDNSPLAGGCTIMNAGVEADDGQSPRLLEQVQQQMRILLLQLEDIVKRGIENKEFRAEAEPHEAATFIMSSIEGGILLRQIFAEESHVLTVKKHLSLYINHELSAISE
ncbi:TetR/AcrR family transcriptional regulator [Paenibacillus glycanilyticus]|uniref:TetR/AcrR family transcriptional regulator n=1 Tax=Paenibacillus glycanilyticus TaxID=126569 RepID=UPI00203A4A05|nr:TetR/AcrR family transcriptional regulator [Paenibacillus glycanilyticus]MCM3631052.1 TetR/AcrR family transcriptional regulator [Paenibacillus glycanilyticus]